MYNGEEELPLPQLRTHRTFLRDERRRDCEKYKNFKDGAEELKKKIFTVKSFVRLGSQQTAQKQSHSNEI